MTLNELNNLDAQMAAQWFEQCCASQAWIEGMVVARPYISLEALEQKAENVWETCTNEDILEAFKAHPMIGNVDSLREKFANTKAIAAGEQSGTSKASEETLKQLHEMNMAYLLKHKFIFIICATGLSAETMLSALQSRIVNNTDEEIKIAAGEQLKITLLRLRKALS